LLPWPAAGEPGYINLHHLLQGGGMPGRPFTLPADFIAHIPHLKKKRDVYWCLSRQKEAGGSRSKANALAVKSIWLDVDGNKADEPDKGYASVPEAQAAVAKFVVDAKLPKPSAIVMSGGGFHVYWISDRTMSVDEWAPYAHGLWALVQKHGLKADPVTTDAARVLRVPGTLNHKTTPPRDVKILELLDHDYDFEQVLGKIRTVVAPQRTASNVIEWDFKKAAAAAIQTRALHC
jgi:hypothetical protein